MNMKKKTGFLSVLIAGFLVIFIASCAGASVDGLLDDYEKVVDRMLECTQEAIKLSDSADSSALSKIESLQKEMGKLQEKLQSIGEKLGKHEDDMTEAQIGRFMAITLKVSDLF